MRTDQTLREDISQWTGKLFSRKTPDDPQAASKEVFWALQDINLEVKQGESLGIIGHNGAGKSTLLRLLSRITEPTTGEIDLRGRVASLLEVATGFHPDLTGRENIYLKGAIMGMGRAETRKRFDAIVDFAEVEKFLDTPVKRYSSGMYVKLGFSVAAHLEPDILIVDEVLAVGDARFQKKCIQKMQSILAAQGRTILFVSHNLGLVRELCQRAVLLESGQLVDSGPASDVTTRYLQRTAMKDTASVADRQDRRGEGQMKLIRVSAFSPGESNECWPLSSGAAARFEFEVNTILPETTIFGLIRDDSGNVVAHVDSNLFSPKDTVVGPSARTFVCNFTTFPLAKGRYSMDVRLESRHNEQDFLVAALVFDVERGEFMGRRQPDWGGIGAVYLDYTWEKPILEGA